MNPKVKEKKKKKRNNEELISKKLGAELFLEKF